MAVKVQLKHLHISPRKVRLVADLVRGADVQEAEKILKFTFKKAAKPIEKLLKSAVATAKNDFSFEESNLFVSEINLVVFQIGFVQRKLKFFQSVDVED